MSLQQLPPELLIKLPGYLHSLADFMSLRQTCHRLRICCDAAPSSHLRNLAARDFGYAPYWPRHVEILSPEIRRLLEL
jgi:hypothetical protein